MAQIEGHLGKYAGSARGLGDAPGALGRDGQGLINVKMFFRRQRVQRHLFVLGVGRAHADHVDILALKQLPVVARPVRAHIRRGTARHRFAARANAANLGAEVRVRVKKRQRAHRQGVRLPHKPPTNNAYAVSAHILILPACFPRPWAPHSLYGIPRGLARGAGLEIPPLFTGKIFRLPIDMYMLKMIKLQVDMRFMLDGCFVFNRAGWNRKPSWEECV